MSAVVERQAVDKKAQINGWYIVAAVLAVLAIQQWWTASRSKRSPTASSRR